MKVKITKKLIRNTIIIIVGIATLVGLYFINHSSILVNKYIDDGYYLCLKDYELIDSHTGDAIDDTHSTSYDYSGESYSYPYGYQTYRGIEVGDSWEDFTDAYGSYYAYYITAAHYINGEIDEDDTKSYYLNWMTINDFDSRYIQSGIIDLDQYNITICFQCDTKGNKFLTTPAQLRYDDSIHFFFNFKNVEYTLYFDFYASNQYYAYSELDHYYLGYISTSKYVY